MPDNSKAPLTECERRVLAAITDEVWCDADRVEHKLAGSGFTVHDVVNALMALNDRGLIATGIDRRGTKPVAYFKRT